ALDEPRKGVRRRLDPDPERRDSPCRQREPCRPAVDNERLTELAGERDGGDRRRRWFPIDGRLARRVGGVEDSQVVALRVWHQTGHLNGVRSQLDTRAGAG